MNFYLIDNIPNYTPFLQKILWENGRQLGAFWIPSYLVGLVVANNHARTNLNAGRSFQHTDAFPSTLKILSEQYECVMSNTIRLGLILLCETGLVKVTTQIRATHDQNDLTGYLFIWLRHTDRARMATGRLTQSPEVPDSDLARANAFSFRQVK